MKANLKALTDEVQQLQTMMLDDVTEFQENIEEIKDALQDRAARRAEASASNGQAPADVAVPTWASIQSPRVTASVISTADTEDASGRSKVGSIPSSPSGSRTVRLTQDRITGGVVPRPLPQSILRSMLSQRSKAEDCEG